MNNFCRHLRLSLSERFNIDIEVYISKKKKLVHMSVIKTLLSYQFFEEIIEFLKKYWKKNYFFPGYFFIYPKLNHSLKWRYGYILTVKKAID